ncbi:MAG: T9SS type A sorting domain-containing protein, partial [Bacteroidia bacterium]|nr:T9SS type A sorting domain-containing protein [Bacteroidia bacterium]
ATGGDQLVNAFYDASSESFGLYFFSKSAEEITIFVHDLTGKIHLKETRSVGGNAFNYFKLQNAGSLSTGIYFISIKTADNKFVKKILKF